MRLVRYEDGDAGVAIDLHPLVTVVSGLRPEARATAPRMPSPPCRQPTRAPPDRSRSTACFLDLTQDSLDLLDLGEDLDVVLRRDDLLAPADEDVALPAGSTGAIGTGDDPVPTQRPLHRDARRSTRPRPQPLHDRLAAVSAALEEAEMTRVDVRLRLSSIFDERARLGADVEAARADVDPSAATRLRLATDELESLRRRHTATAVESLSSRRHSLEVAARGPRRRCRPAAPRAEAARRPRHHARPRGARGAALGHRPGERSLGRGDRAGRRAGGVGRPARRAAEQVGQRSVPADGADRPSRHRVRRAGRGRGGPALARARRGARHRARDDPRRDLRARRAHLEAEQQPPPPPDDPAARARRTSCSPGSGSTPGRPT